VPRGGKLALAEGVIEMFVGKWVLVVGSRGMVGCSPDESAMSTAVVVAVEATMTCEVPA
jgi:hypothetical protein